MKSWNTIWKVLAAIVALAGIVYVVATYGDRIVAWAKKLLKRSSQSALDECDYDCDNCDCDCDDSLDDELTAADNDFVQEYLANTGSKLAMYDVEQTNEYMKQLDASIKAAVG